jgi:four helix bundle protein
MEKEMMFEKTMKFVSRIWNLSTYMAQHTEQPSIDHDILLAATNIAVFYRQTQIEGLSSERRRFLNDALSAGFFVLTLLELIELCKLPGHDRLSSLHEECSEIIGLLLKELKKPSPKGKTKPAL